MALFSGARKPKGVTSKAARKAIRAVLAEKPRDIKELNRALKAAGHSTLSWSGLTLEQQIERVECENIRKKMRDIEDIFQGKRVRPFQAITRIEPLGLVGKDGKPRLKRVQEWFSLADVLVVNTQYAKGSDADVSAREVTTDMLTALLHDYMAQNRGLVVKIDGIEYVANKVKDGFVFQPSMFGLEPDGTTGS